MTDQKSEKKVNTRCQCGALYLSIANFCHECGKPVQNEVMTDEEYSQMQQKDLRDASLRVRAMRARPSELRTDSLKVDEKDKRGKVEKKEEVILDGNTIFILISVLINGLFVFELFAKLLFVDLEIWIILNVAVLYSILMFFVFYLLGLFVRSPQRRGLPKSFETSESCK